MKNLQNGDVLAGDKSLPLDAATDQQSPMPSCLPAQPPGGVNHNGDSSNIEVGD